MSNFDFLTNEWISLYNKTKKAEERIITEPVSSATYCRLVLEECIHSMYELEFIELPYNKELASLLMQEELKDLIPSNIYAGVQIVRKTGNRAVHHGRKVQSSDALIGIKYLYTFLKWYANNYSQVSPELPGKFDESLIPKEGAQRRLKTITEEGEREQRRLREQIDQLIAEKENLLETARESEEKLNKYKEQEESGRKAIAEQRKTRVQKISSEFTEAETRVHLIDVNLKEAGWDTLRAGYELEYPVKGMPVSNDNPSGNGFADYVLWDDNGKPLALIEAKRTSKEAEAGKHQAFLYANCLEQMHQQRPVIFFSNGYETRLWDDVFYSGPRMVHGFYTKGELQELIEQRRTRKDIRLAKMNEEIAGRPYQMVAIKRICESFVVDGADSIRGNKRHALLVMATGSGKTRTAAALVDVLMKNNWIKRVLFLADRNALVRQAKNNFNDYLPSLSSIDLTEADESDKTRLVFSTYPTMMNRIDSSLKEGKRHFGVGHFDLIIVDEAHRSVYNRYKAIFDYFDALIVGLTATPKDNIDRNTFELFECGSGDPTFSFDLDEATPTYLNPYKNIGVSTGFLRDGIRYNELSEDEKEQYEQTFMDSATGLFPEWIHARALNKWLFNKDTVNKVLDTLMEQGLKIEGGDKVGRTIIFAMNQKHAQFIEDCFVERYPELPSGFVATIHNKISHTQSLIDSFCDHHEEKNPQVVISVDMMDTGIDAPRVLNLVFFKIVRSYAKFWQMIGRGTRLCPDVFGPGQKKDHFLIFDACENFEFFEINQRGSDGNDVRPVTQQIFESRLQLSSLLAETGEVENIDLAKELLNILHHSISHLNREHFQVKMKLRQVDEFNERERWDNLSADDVHLIEEHLSALPVPERINEVARRFDLLVLRLQIAKLLGLGTVAGYQDNLISIADQLSSKYTIPQVLRAMDLIEHMKDPDFYAELSQRKLEEIREQIRELVQYLDAKSRKPVYTHFEDSDVTLSAGHPLTTYNYGVYKKRVERYIRDHKHELAIAKLSANVPITDEELIQLEKILFDGEERGTKDDFKKEYGEQPLGKFIRSIVGLEVEAANSAFADFLQVGNLRADQMTFINTIISFLTSNGTINKAMLFESPFTDVNDQGLVGVFEDADAVKIISIIDEINENANVG
jgi:type I restriction enzyme, R subunit